MRQIGLGVLQNVRHRSLEMGWPLCKHHPALEQKCPKLVDDRRAPADRAVTHAVDTLQVQLVIGLNRDKAHVLPFDGLSDRLCIDEVVLVRLHEWLYKLSGDQPDIMALL